MELAVIISLIALLVALPSCIADSLLIIEKLRARKKDNSSLLPLDSLKKVARSGLDHAQRLLFFKKAAPFHRQISVRAACLIMLAITVFTLVSFPPPTAFAPTENLKVMQIEQNNSWEAKHEYEKVLRLHDEVVKISGKGIYQHRGDSDIDPDTIKKALKLMNKRGYKKSSLWILYHELAYLNKTA